MNTVKSMRGLAILAMFLALPTGLGADDRAYLVTDLRPAADGSEILLRSLQEGEKDKTFKLAVRAAETLIDLAAAAPMPSSRIRRGDILFVAGSGAERRLMVITPGETVQAELARKQPHEAEVIDRISRQVAATLNRPGESNPPPAAVSADLDRVRRSFLFVLEFALGAPLTAAQERQVLDSFGPDWWSAKSEPERKSFLRYPQIVSWILHAGQNELEELRSSLEGTTRQWLDESPAADPVVAMIRSRLQERGRIVYPGDPPLTEMAATAFCELYAYARLLQRDGTATPDQVTAGETATIRYDLLRVWSGFSVAERTQVATAPGIWLVLRTLIVHGDQAQREAARQRLRSVPTGQSRQPSLSADVQSETNRQIMNNMIKHNVLMNIQQQTFNSYMWSRGFNYLPATGKMW